MALARSQRLIYIQGTAFGLPSKDEAEVFEAAVRLCDTSALFRAHPEYQVPIALHGATRAVLRVEVFCSGQQPLQ